MDLPGLIEVVELFPILYITGFHLLDYYTKGMMLAKISNEDKCNDCPDGDGDKFYCLRGLSFRLHQAAYLEVLFIQFIIGAVVAFYAEGGCIERGLFLLTIAAFIFVVPYGVLTLLLKDTFTWFENPKNRVPLLILILAFIIIIKSDYVWSGLFQLIQITSPLIVITALLFIAYIWIMLRKMREKNNKI